MRANQIDKDSRKRDTLRSLERKFDLWGGT